MFESPWAHPIYWLILFSLFFDGAGKGPDQRSRWLNAVLSLGLETWASVCPSGCSGAEDDLHSHQRSVQDLVHPLLAWPTGHVLAVHARMSAHLALRPCHRLDVKGGNVPSFRYRCPSRQCSRSVFSGTFTSTFPAVCSLRALAVLEVVVPVTFIKGLEDQCGRGTV